MQLPPRRTWPRGFYIRIDTPIREPSNLHFLLEIFNQANTAFEFSIQREYRGPKGGVEMISTPCQRYPIKLTPHLSFQFSGCIVAVLIYSPSGLMS